MSENLRTEMVIVTGHGADEVAAYVAVPLDDGPHPGVVVIHHMPGFDAATKEITRRFAAHGYMAVCPNLHFRDGPEASPDDAAAACRAAGGLPDERVVGDVHGAAEYIRAMAAWNGKIGVIGHCSGGRHAVLAACDLSFDAAVDCYGAAVLHPPPADWTMRMGSLADRLPELSAPLLGLFGAEDTNPAPSEVEELRSLLVGHGKAVDFHVFDGAGHAFFASDRESYRPSVANEGWRLIWRFLDERLSR
jgi:carboxymethylenebutenolidase